MKKILLCAALFLPAFTFAVDNPSDLINAVKRSQVITELYMERWNLMDNSMPMEKLTLQRGSKKPIKKYQSKLKDGSDAEEKIPEGMAEESIPVEDEELSLQEKYYYINRGSFAKYVDIYFHGESIPNYSVIVPGYGSKEVTLFRIFGSTIIKFEDLVDLGPTSWGFAISAAGFRYGLKKKSQVNNDTGVETGTGGSSSSFETTDYLYSQIYDDLIVVTQLFKGFGYIHTGILLNDQIDPGPDGMMGSSDDVRLKSSSRFFLDSNVFGFLFVNLGYNSKEDKAEYATTKIEIFDLFKIFGNLKKRAIYPDLYLGYSYNNPRTANNDLQAVHLLFLEGLYSYYNNFYLKARTDMYLYGRSGLEKDYSFKQWYFELGINPTDQKADAFTKEQTVFFHYYFIFGLSYIVDNRLAAGNGIGNETTPDVYGYSLGIKGTFAAMLGGLTMELRVSRNYSPKLYTLMEAYNHWIGEASLQVSF